jgi:hypothetical protein
MPDWMLPRLTDYWDQQVDAIERLSRVLAGMPETERVSQLASISAAVSRHAQILDDDILAKSAAAVVQDLYKAVCARTYLDEPLLQYLTASCQPYFQELSQRGYVVQYLIDNTWERLDGPAIAFPIWFAAAAMLYICPQHIACRAFEKDSPQEEWPALVSKNIAAAREVAGQLVDRCNAEGRHFVYLDTDARDADLEVATKAIGWPGVIHIFRQEAAASGSRCVVTLPTSKRNAAFSPNGPARA